MRLTRRLHQRQAHDTPTPTACQPQGPRRASRLLMGRKGSREMSHSVAYVHLSLQNALSPAIHSLPFGLFQNTHERARPGLPQSDGPFQTGWPDPPRHRHDERRDRAFPGDPFGARRAGVPLSRLPHHAGAAQLLFGGGDAHAAVQRAAGVGLDRAGQYRAWPPALAEYLGLRAGLLRGGRGRQPGCRHGIERRRPPLSGTRLVHPRPLGVQHRLHHFRKVDTALPRPARIPGRVAGGHEALPL